MDDFLKTLANFLSTQGLGTGIVLFIAWFLTVKAWPWYTTVYFSAMQAERVVAASKVDAQTEALVEVKVAMVQAVQQLEALKSLSITANQSLLEHRADFNEALRKIEQRAGVTLLPSDPPKKASRKKPVPTKKE